MYSIENREYHVIKGVIMLLLNQALFLAGDCLFDIKIAWKQNRNIFKW